MTILSYCFRFSNILLASMIHFNSITSTLPKLFRIRRGGSRGFMLTEDSMDDDFYIHSLIQEKEWLDKFRKKLNGSVFAN